MNINGRARVFGDDVNTDYIISSRRKRETIDESRLREYLFEAIDPSFAASLRPDDILVGGANFGCGSAMEVAVTVIQSAGIRVVVAQSFARSFFRNAINNGLMVVECDTSSITEGNRLELEIDGSSVTVRDPDRQLAFTGASIPPLMQAILAAGGLVGFLRGGGRFEQDG